MELFDGNNLDHKDPLKYKVIKRGTVWNHVMLMLDSVPIEERTITMMLTILSHDMGKMVVENEIDGESIHFKGHAEETWVAENFLRRITDEVNLIKDVLTLIQYHMRPYELKECLNKRLLRRLALSVDIPMLMQLHKADLLGRGEKKDISHIETFLTMWEEVKNEIKPLVKGKDLIELGIQPVKESGQTFGFVLKKLFNLQIEGVFDTKEKGLKLLGKLFYTNASQECEFCHGWGRKYTEAGIPNKSILCPHCMKEKK